MRKCPAYILTLLVMHSIAFAQAKDEETINWQPSRQLTWNDYKGKPDPNAEAAASTTTYLGIEYKMEDKSFSWKIQCRFSLTKSWGRTKTDLILKHEQGHFDIAEIFARKLHKRMKEYRFNQSTYQTDLRQIYSTITAEKEAFQDLYDNETDHSRKKDEQEKWLKKIETMLEELKGFANYS